MAGQNGKVTTTANWALLREGAVSYAYVLLWIVLSATVSMSHPASAPAQTWVISWWSTCHGVCVDISHRRQCLLIHRSSCSTNTC